MKIVSRALHQTWARTKRKVIKHQLQNSVESLIRSTTQTYSGIITTSNQIALQTNRKVAHDGALLFHWKPPSLNFRRTTTAWKGRVERVKFHRSNLLLCGLATHINRQHRAGTKGNYLHFNVFRSSEIKDDIYVTNIIGRTFTFHNRNVLPPAKVLRIFSNERLPFRYFTDKFLGIPRLILQTIRWRRRTFFTVDRLSCFNCFPKPNDT